ncbi:MarR family winged helix-turn-helix transcriptional regulator [Phenylobacterium sp.]|uniref:MarR family winged helix-turn-helix transcriptional regulator n=1 Tax=Phenylobacterium sp. TaxID=1871053 RepID=UPI003002BCB6
MRNRPSPADLTDHLGYWLRLVSNAVSQSFARRVEAEGVTVAEWVFLRALYDVEPMAPSQLAERMGMTRGAISKLADRLAAKDLVERREAGGDGRRQSLTLRPPGHALVPRLAALADQNDAASFEGLTPEERGELERLLRKLAAAQNLNAAPIT